MALTILFWNVHKNDNCREPLVRLASVHGVDILLVAECFSDRAKLLAGLNKSKPGQYHEANGGPTGKVVVFTILPDKHMKLRYTNAAEDTTVWKITSFTIPLLLAAVHLPAKTGGVTESDQTGYARALSEQIALTEDVENISATVVVGDLNMNPFDAGIASVTGLHGLMTRELAAKGERKHRGESYRRFYNPMWGLFGDRTAGPAGTFFWDSSMPSNQHWYILDQVLLRPELMDQIQELRILDTDGSNSLLKGGRPTKSHLSDHLPILLRLDV